MYHSQPPLAAASMHCNSHSSLKPAFTSEVGCGSSHSRKDLSAHEQSRFAGLHSGNLMLLPKARLTDSKQRKAVTPISKSNLIKIYISGLCCGVICFDWSVSPC